MKKPISVEFWNSSLKRSGLHRLTCHSHTLIQHNLVSFIHEWNESSQPQSITALWLVLISCRDTSLQLPCNRRDGGRHGQLVGRRRRLSKERDRWTPSPYHRYCHSCVAVYSNVSRTIHWRHCDSARLQQTFADAPTVQYFTTHTHNITSFEHVVDKQFVTRRKTKFRCRY